MTTTPALHRLRLLVVITAAIATAFAITAPRAALADEPPTPQARQQAKSYALQARRHYELGDYPAAIEGYKRAYLLAPSAGVLFDLGQTYRHAGNCIDAAEVFRSYLRIAPAGEPHRIAERLLRELAPCEKRAREALAKPQPTVVPVDVPTPAAVAVAVDAPRSHEPHPITAPPPPPKLLSPQAAAQVFADQYAPAPAHAPGSSRAAPSAAAHDAKLRRAGIITAVGGGALVTCAVVFGAMAVHEADVVNAQFAAGGPGSAVTGADSRGHRDDVLATVLGIGGGAAIVTGIALYVAGREPSAREHDHPQLTVASVRGGGALGVSWGF